MKEAYFYAVGSVVVVSLLSLVGIFTLTLSRTILSKILMFLVSFAAGALLGDTFLHLLPEVVAELGFTFSISLSVLAGIFVFFVLEKFIRWRHCHMSDAGATIGDHHHHHPFAVMNLVGDSLHNFIDGILIGVSYLVSVPLGVATTVAVILHEIPQEIGDFGVLLYGGFSRRKALFLNFITALTAVFGTLLALWIGAHIESLVLPLVAFTAGGFIYIAVADLFPEMHKERQIGKSALEFFALLLGVGMMAFLL